MENSLLKKVLRVLKPALGLGLFAVLLYLIDLNELFTLLTQASLLWLLGTIVASLLVFDFQGFLLGVVASPFARIPHGRLFVFTLIGRFFSLFLPSSVGGDLVKVFYLFPYFRKPADAYAAIFMQRLLGGMASLTVSFVAAVAFLPLNYSHPLLIAGGTMMVAAVFMLAIYYRYKSGLWQAARRRKTESAGASGLVGIIYSLLGSILAYRYQKGAVIKTFLLACGGTFLVTGMYMLVARTFLISLSFEQALVSASITQLSVLIPLTPGGIGVSEGTFVVASGIMGVPAEQAMAIMIGARMIGYIAAAPGGIFYMLMPIKGSCEGGSR